MKRAKPKQESLGAAEPLLTCQGASLRCSKGSLSLFLHAESQNWGNLLRDGALEEPKASHTFLYSLLPVFFSFGSSQRATTIWQVEGPAAK